MRAIVKRIHWAGIARAVRVGRFGRVDRDIDEELRFHLESRVAELIASGKASSDAWNLARKDFGDLDEARRGNRGTTASGSS